MKCFVKILNNMIYIVSIVRIVIIASYIARLTWPAGPISNHGNS